jgi:hypothetical protein
MFKTSNQNDCEPVVDPIDIIILVDQYLLQSKELASVFVSIIQF